MKFVGRRNFKYYNFLIGLPLILKMFIKDNFILLNLTILSLIAYMIFYIKDKKNSKSLQTKEIIFSTLFILAIHCFGLWIVYTIFGTFLGLTFNRISFNLIQFDSQNHLTNSMIFIWLAFICIIPAYLLYFSYVKEKYANELTNKHKIFSIIKYSVLEYFKTLLIIPLIYAVFILVYWITLSIS